MRSWRKMVAALMVGPALLSGCIIRTTPGYYGGGTVVGGDGFGFAQLLQIGGNQANYGYVTMGPNFQPDPVRVNVVSGGAYDARRMGLPMGCVGWVTRTPDYIIRFTGPTNMLRFYVAGNTDTTLVINSSDGRWHCNDDSYGSTNPTVSILGAPPGQYDVWVGSYRQGERATAVLNITEMDLRPGM